MKKLILLLFIPLVFTCSSDSSDDSSPCPNQPQLTTNEVSDIIVDAVTDLASATFSGEILNIQLGDNCETFSITNQGFVYSTNIQPTIEDNVVNANGESVMVILDGLPLETTYYVRTFITNVLGTFYGNEVSFTIPSSINPIYLDDNGITIKAKEWAEVGMNGVVNGITYTIVDRPVLQTMIANDQDVTAVCTSLITNMAGLFMYSSFNQNISSWDVSNVTDFSNMFMESHFNQPIGDWDVSSATIMSNMFTYSPFDQPIGEWDVSSVENISYMFGHTPFNQPIGNWDVSNVIYMFLVFRDAQFFNQDISSWNVSSVEGMVQMFDQAEQFNQDLSMWQVENVYQCSSFACETPNWSLPKPNFPNFCGNLGCN